MKSNLFPAIGLKSKNVQEMLFRVHISYKDNENYQWFHILIID